MVACESNRDKYEVCLALLHVVRDCVAGLCAKPGGGTDLRLPDKAVRVAVGEAGHDSVDGGGNFSGVRVS